MLEKKDSASSGVLLLCGGSGGGSRSLDEEDANVVGTSTSETHSQRLEAGPALPEPTWCRESHDSESEEHDEERPETRSLLEGTSSAPTWQIPVIHTPSHSSSSPIAIDNDSIVMPSEFTYFDESGEKCCIKNMNQECKEEDKLDNLLVQDSGSQLLFPMDVSMVLEGGEDGTTPALSRVTSACSTVALEEEDEEALRQITPRTNSALVIGSAPAGPIVTNKGILQIQSSAREHRKNSQVCFREEDQDTSVAGTPLLPASHHHSTRTSDPTGKREDDEEWELEPPDGGWGWLVLAGSVLVNILVPGTVKSFGVLFVEFLEVFNATPVAASWIPALCYFLYSSLGPVASVLSAKFSYRTVTFLGGGFAAFGMVLSYFANSIAYLYISFGVLVGTGAGLAFPPGVFIVSSYFQRRRGLANGICISGSAIGSMILPPLLRHLLNTYGYRGAVLIMGGITFNVWVGAMFYHPVERHMRRVRKQGCTPPPRTTSPVEASSPDTAPLAIEGVKSPSPQVAMSQPITIPSGGDPQQTHVPRDFIFYFGDGSPEHDAEYEKRWLAAQSSSFIGPNIDKASLEKSPSPLALRDVLENSQIDAAARLLANGEKKNWDVFSTLPASTQRVLRLSMRPNQSQAVAAALQKSSTGPGQLSRSFSSNVSLSSFRYISTVHHGSTLAALQQNPPDNEFASTLTLRSVSQSCWESALECARAFCSCGRLCKRSKKDHDEPSSPGKLIKNNNNAAEKSDDKSDDKSDASSKLLDLSLLKDSLYLVILLSNSTNAIGYTNFIILLPAYAISLGFDKSSASLLLSLVAALDLVGRIGGSALSDLHFVPRKYYYIGGLALSGAILTFIPLLATVGYTSLAISCAIFGLGSGTYVGVTAVLMADMLGAERLASSFGMSLFVNGVLQLLGPPVCGLALQELQSYAPIFSTLGVVLLLGAAMWGFIPLIERKRRMENQELV